MARLSLKLRALRYATLSTEITAIDEQLLVLVRSVNPRLLTLNGVGAMTAALLTAAGDNPKRLASTGAVAALTGSSRLSGVPGS